MSLSLSKKAIILVSVPVLFEIGLVSTLAAAFIRAEAARKQENYARELTGHLNNMMAMHLQRVAFLVLSHSAPSPALDTRVTLLRNKMLTEGAEINKLASHDPAQKEKWKGLVELAKKLDDTFFLVKLYYSKDNKMAAAFQMAKLQQYLDQFIQLNDQLQDTQAQLLNERHQELLKSAHEI